MCVVNVLLVTGTLFCPLILLSCGVNELVSNFVHEEPTEKNTETEIPLIESTELSPGIYRMDIHISQSSNYKLVYVGTRPTEDNNVYVRIPLDPKPWSTTEDGVPIHIPGLDKEFLVEIYEFVDVTTETRGNVKRTFYNYKGKLLKNLSRPDVLIEYE